MGNDQKIQEIVSRFKPESFKQTRPEKKNIIDPKTKLERTAYTRKTRDVEFTVIDAADFDALVQAVFEFPEERRYSVRLDLWGSIQHGLDHFFEVKAKGFPLSNPVIDDFKKKGRRVGKVRFLFDYFIQSKVLSPGKYVIRFPQEAADPLPTPDRRRPFPRRAPTSPTQ